VIHFFKKAQLESMQKIPRTDLSTIVDFATTETYQKSALMEDFEEISPQNEFSDYINLQKEIKRLNEENRFFMSENKQLTSRIKALENRPDTTPNIAEDNGAQSDLNEQRQRELEAMIDELKQEIFVSRYHFRLDYLLNVQINCCWF